MSWESCPSTQSTWLLTRKAIFLPLHSYPSASTKGRVVSLELNSPSWTIWQSVTNFIQPSLKVSSVTHLTLKSSLEENIQQNQANPMPFSFCWILILINLVPHVRMLMPQTRVTKASRSSSTHSPNTPHLDQDHMEWALWRKWQEHQVLSTFLTTRRSARSTTGKSVRQRNTWSRFEMCADVFDGL